jgi:predicted ArsR family transcriptional regulator
VTATDLDFTLARRSDPETSKAAARATSFAAGHCRMILDSLATHGPQTKDELAAHTRLDSVAVARRMATLRDQLLVRDSGTTRPTLTGRAATVWELRA